MIHYYIIMSNPWIIKIRACAAEYQQEKATRPKPPPKPRAKPAPKPKKETKAKPATKPKAKPAPKPKKETKAKPAPKPKKETKAKPAPKPKAKPEPMKEPEKPKKEKEPERTSNKCIESIEALYKELYQTKKPNIKTFENLLEHYKHRKEIMNAITNSDFYPTPPKYGEMIYNDIRRTFGNNKQVDEIYDIGAGLVSLSMPLIKEGYKVVLIELDEFIYNAIKCLESSNVNVFPVNYFNMPINIPKNSTTILISNPPFRARLFGANEAKAWVFFLVSIIHKLTNINIQNAYVIVPFSSEHIKLSTGKELNKDNDVGKQIEFTVKGALWKRIKDKLKIEDEEESFEYSYIHYMAKVSGFKGISKSGAPRNAPDAMLLKIGF